MKKITAGIDIGFGDVKYVVNVDENLEVRGKFPTVSKKTSDIAKLGNKISNPKYKVKHNNELYYVGEKALIEGAERNWDTKVYNNSDYRLFVDSAIALALHQKNKKGQQIEIAGIGIALPISVFRDLTDKDKKRILDIFKESSSVEIEDETYYLEYDMNSIYINAQGYVSAIYFDSQMDNPLEGEIYYGDIGYNTYDEFVLIVSSDNMDTVDTTIKTTEDTGIRTFYTSLAQAFKKHVQVELSVDKLKHSVEADYSLRVKGQSYDAVLKEAYNYQCKSYARTYADKIRKTVGSERLNTLSAVILTGGGSEMFGDMILDELGYKDIFKKDEFDRSFSNALGCAFIAKYR